MGFNLTGAKHDDELVDSRLPESEISFTPTALDMVLALLRTAAALLLTTVTASTAGFPPAPMVEVAVPQTTADKWGAKQLNGDPPIYFIRRTQAPRKSDNWVCACVRCVCARARVRLCVCACVPASRSPLESLCPCACAPACILLPLPLPLPLTVSSLSLSLLSACAGAVS